MPANLNQEWLNQNSLRAYPIREDVSRNPVDSNGNVLSFELPNYVIVDLILTIADLELVTARISQITKLGNLMTIVIQDTNGVQVTSCTVDLSTHVTNQVYRLIGSGLYADTHGDIVIGDLTTLDTDMADGLYTFPASSMLFETRCIRPDIRGIRSISVLNDSSVSEPLYGNVVLRAGSNVRLRYIPADNAIEFNAINGEGLNEECPCASSFGQDNVVRRVNGLAIENVQLIAGDCVELEASGNKLTIKDTCSKPCCSCPELDALTTSLRVLDVSLQTLESYSQQLSNKVTEFVNNYVLATLR